MNDRGARNVWTAAAPDFRPVNLTGFGRDEVFEIDAVLLTDDGATAVFVKGGRPNAAGWVTNSDSDPDGREQAVWAVRTERRKALEGRRRQRSGPRAGWAVRAARQRRLDLSGPAQPPLRPGSGPRAGAALPGGRPERLSPLLPGRDPRRLRQQPRRPQPHRRVRSGPPQDHLDRPRRRPRQRPALVGGRDADRLHPPARPDLRRRHDG